MAVSLVSTGIQFPDSTIQTTAASAAPSATALGAVVLTGVAGTDPGSFNTFLTTLGSNNLYTTPLTAVTSSYTAVTATSSSTTASISSMSYSSFYGLWFGIAGGASNTLTSYGGVPIVSADGLHWTPVVTSFTFPTAPFNYGIASIGVNDSNGTIYILSAVTDSQFSIYKSTDSGITWSLTYGPNTTNWNMNYASQPTFRYLNTGTASTSKSVFTVGYNYTAAVVVAPGDSDTFSIVSASGDGGGYVSDVRPASVATYGTIMWYRHCNDGCAIYNAATGALTNTALGNLYIPSTGSRRLRMAINDSYFIGPSTTQGYISYGTISGATPTYAGQVLLPKNTGAYYDPNILSCVYDGTRWMAITDQGLCYTANANPSSGWARAPMTRGVINPNYNNYLSYALNQRDPIR